MLIYWVLLGGTLFFALAGVGLLLWRSREIPVKESHETFLSRNFGFFVGIILLVVLSLLTLLGTSAPLITRLWGKPSNVSTQFYTWTSTPLGILIALLIAIVPVMTWRKTEPEKLLERLSWPIALSLMATGLCFVFGVRNPALMLLTLFSFIALLTNGILALKIIRAGSWLTASGYLVHVGVALMLLGFVGSAGYSKTQMVTLTNHTVAHAFGYEFRYDGWTKDSMKRDALKIYVKGNGKEFTAHPVLAVYERGGEPMVIKHPDVTKLWNYDLYISPDNYIPPETPGVFRLQKDEAKEIAGYKITFRKFHVPDMEKMHEGGTVHVGAILDVEYQGKKTTVEPLFVLGPQERKSVAAKLPGPAGAAVDFEGMNVESRQIELSLKGVKVGGPKPQETVSLEISKKPMMNVLLLGTWIVVLGGIMTIRRRVLEVAPEVSSIKTAEEKVVKPRKGRGKPVPAHSSVKR